MPFLSSTEGTVEPLPDFKQVCVFTENNDSGVQDIALIDSRKHNESLGKFHGKLEHASSAWARNVHTRGSQYPVVVPKHLLSELESFNDVLVLAVTDIVERWWKDEGAQFYKRMPIETHFEEVLRWIDSPTSGVAPFHERRGCWRPDLLFDSQSPVESLRVCEINARFAFNGFFMSCYGQESLPFDGMISAGIEPIIDPPAVYESYAQLINEKLPIHLVKGREYGIDIFQFREFIHRRTGTAPRFVTPSELRLVPNAASPSGYRLACLAEVPEAQSTFEHNGEQLEPVHQCALELHQSELVALSQDMLRTLAPICFNDLRTIFLVHDKRLLGIVLQSIQELTSSHGVLTPAQGAMLRGGILETIIPGSPELDKLIARASSSGAEHRHDWLLKPTGAGKGEGIIFGDEFGDEESWLAALAKLQTRTRSSPEACLYVVQRLARQPRYDVLLPEAELKVQRGILVHTYMCIGGRYLGLGIARTSAGRIAAVSHGGAWIPTVRAQTPRQVESASEDGSWGESSDSQIGVVE